MIEKPGIGFKVEPGIKDLYEELNPEHKRQLKSLLVEKILVFHAEENFNIKEYAKEHGVSLQIGDTE